MRKAPADSYETIIRGEDFYFEFLGIGLAGASRGYSKFVHLSDAAD
jgi:hypothetical protein